MGQGGPGFSCEDKAGKEVRASLISACTTAHVSSGVAPFMGSYHPAQRDVGAIQVEPVGRCSGRHQCFLLLLLNLGIVVLQREERDR